MDKYYIGENASLLEICDPCNHKIAKDMAKQLSKKLTDIFQKSEYVALVMADNKENRDIFIGIDGQYHPKGYFLDINGRYYPPTENFLPGTNAAAYPISIDSTL